MSSDLRQSVSGLYTLGKTIGRGHYAVVKLARHNFTEREVAVKVIDKLKLDEISQAHLFQEVICMKLVQHPNVVRLYEVIDTSTKLYLILELADGGDMFDYLIKHVNGLNESLARKYFQQICRALKFCHEMHICHRDLKPENLVFFEKQGVVKLTDFGFSNQFYPGKKLCTSCGSLAYSAPEILLGDPYDAPAVDVWSLGVILFMLVTGRPPFQEANDSETIMMILDCCYKLPSNVSMECQNLIHLMIVRDPEKRATLDDVMSDVWYQQCDIDDEDDNNDEMDIFQSLSDLERNLLIDQMIEGDLADKDSIINAIKNNEYNHLTATYYLLAEKYFRDQKGHTFKRKKRSLQPTNDPFQEQIGNVIFPSANFYIADVSLPISRRNSLDEGSDDYSGKENVPPVLSTPRHSIDLSTEQTLSTLIEDDEEEPIVQQRSTNTNTQAMKIILEEDEYSETPTTEQTNPFKPKNKVEEEKVSTANNLRSVVETKRRHLSRSCSNSDSEDNESTHETTRSINRKQTRSSQYSNESDIFNSQRQRSFSNIEHIINEFPSNPSQIMVSTTNDYLKRRSNSSRTNSIISTNRFPSIYSNENETSRTNSLIFINDRSKSLSNEHRLANQSQISIASRTSIRYTTPRESTVFTKTEAPPVVRLLQQTPHHDTTEMIKMLIEYQRLETINQESLQTPIIIEQDICPPLFSFTNETSSKPKLIDNHNRSSNSMFSRLKYSIIKHQHQRKPLKKSTNKQRQCCTIS